MQPMERGGELVLLPPLQRLDPRGRLGVGELDRREPHRRLAFAEGVAGMGVAEFGHRADIPGAERGRLDPLFALDDGEVRQLLRRFVFRVPDLVAILDGAAIEPEEAHVPDVRLRDRLEHAAHQRCVGRRRDFGRAGEEGHHLGEEGADPVGELARAAEQGDHRPGNDRPLHRRAEVLARHLLAAEVAFDEGVVGGGHRFGELLGIALDLVGLGRRDRDVDVFSLGPRLVLVAMTGEEVHDPVEGLAVTHRDLDRRHSRREVLLDVGVDLVEVGVLLVHPRHHQDTREVERIAHLPDPLRPDLDAAGSGDDDHRGIGHAQGAGGLADVFEVAGGVEEVDLDLLPISEGQAQPDAVLGLDLFWTGIGQGGPVADRAVAAAGAADEREGIDEGGLPGTAVPHDGDVPDGLRSADRHRSHSSRGCS